MRELGEREPVCEKDKKRVRKRDLRVRETMCVRVKVEVKARM